MDEILRNASAPFIWFKQCLKRSIPFILPLWLLLLSVSMVYAAARASLQTPTSVNAVTVDGKWTSSKEWEDASEVAMFVAQGEGGAYMSVKHDSSNIYFLFDFVTDISPAPEQPTGGDAYDSAHVSIDSDDNLIWDENIDFDVGVKWLSQFANYTVSAFSWFRGAMSYTSTNHSEKAHAVYEFVIQKSALHNSTMVGIRASIWDPTTSTNLHWPNWRKDGWNPQYYGDLVFSNIVIPEFNIAVAAVLVSVSLFAAQHVLKRKKQCS